jgi:hypothetical protein
MRISMKKLPGCKRLERCIPLSASLAQERADALERLVTLLEGSETPLRLRHIPAEENETSQLQRMARLRAAHASYALSSGLVPREGQGAWIRSR